MYCTYIGATYKRCLAQCIFHTSSPHQEKDCSRNQNLWRTSWTHPVAVVGQHCRQRWTGHDSCDSAACKWTRGHWHWEQKKHSQQNQHCVRCITSWYTGLGFACQWQWESAVGTDQSNRLSYIMSLVLCMLKSRDAKGQFPLYTDKRITNRCISSCTKGRLFWPIRQQSPG